MLNKISVNLKRLRRKKGYYLEKLHCLVDSLFNTIVKVEKKINKNLTIETLTKIVKTLEIDIDYLIK